MGRPPSNGGPTFRFMPNEVTEMENILHDHNYVMPSKEVLVALAEKFSENPDRKGNFIVQMKQVWNWFQNRRYAVRANKSKTPVNVTPVSRDEPTQVKSMPPPIATPTPTPTPAPAAAPTPAPASAPAPAPAPASAPAPISAPTPTAAAMITPPASTAGRATSENSSMEFEAKSARDGAWYDVGQFLSHKHLDTADPEVLVRFAGFGPDEDEWINVRKNIRQRSLPCEASECVAVLPGDLILCFQEGKDQALYFDAHVLDAQRRRHDVRGCRCRFLVRYDHDHSEEIVPLRKVCRRPETDYRLQQLQAANDAATADQQKTITNPPGILLNAKASLTPKTTVPEMKTAHPPTTANIGTPAIGSGTYTSNPNVPATGTVNAGSSGAAR